VTHQRSGGVDAATLASLIEGIELSAARRRWYRQRAAAWGRHARGGPHRRSRVIFSGPWPSSPPSIPWPAKSTTRWCC